MAKLMQKVWFVPTTNTLDAAVKKAAAQEMMSLAAYVRSAVVSQLKSEGVDLKAQP